MPLVSIITINYKNHFDTIECLASLLRLDYSPYQIIVIDNNSQNDSVSRIKKWLKAEERVNFNWDSLNMGAFSGLSMPPVSFISYRFDGEEFVEEEKQLLNNNNDKTETENIPIPPLILINSNKNLGFSGANNVGIKFALNKNPPDFFWFLNNDTVVPGMALKELIEVINKAENIGAVGSKIVDYSNPLKVQFFGGTRIKFISKTQKGQDIIEIDKELDGYITGSSFLIKKEIINKVGMWEEKYFMTVEDVDYSYRIKKAGYKLFFAAKSIIYHKDGASTAKKIEIKSFLGKKTARVCLETFYIVGYYAIRNSIFFYKEYKGIFFKIFYFFLYLPYYFMGMVLFIMIFDDHKSERIKLVAKAFKDGLINKSGALGQ